MKTVAWRLIIAIVQGRWLNHQKRFCWSKTNVKHHWNTYLKTIGLTFTALSSIRARWKTKAKQFTGAKVLWVMELSEVPFLKFEQKQIGVIWLWRKIWKKNALKLLAGQRRNLEQEWWYGGQNLSGNQTWLARNLGFSAMMFPLQSFIYFGHW